MYRNMLACFNGIVTLRISRDSSLSNGTSYFLRTAPPEAACEVRTCTAAALLVLKGPNPCWSSVVIHGGVGVLESRVILKQAMMRCSNGRVLPPLARFILTP